MFRTSAVKILPLGRQVGPELFRQVASFAHILGHITDEVPPAQVASPETSAPSSDGALVPVPGTPPQPSATEEGFA
eukprot:2053879-Alexandrium_andersonii.AAC.1